MDVACVSCWLLLLASITTCYGRDATCFLQPDPKSSQPASGLVTFKQTSAADEISISVNITGLDPVSEDSPASDFDHGFHVHAYGDISGGCISTGGHYNPEGVNHGGPNAAVRHPGDFGNLVQTPQGSIVTSFTDHMASLFGDKSIIGRAIVLHAGQDDIGLGGNAGSLANGNAGSRLACCVIGWAK